MGQAFLDLNYSKIKFWHDFCPKLFRRKKNAKLEATE